MNYTLIGSLLTLTYLFTGCIAQPDEDGSAFDGALCSQFYGVQNPSTTVETDEESLTFGQRETVTSIYTQGMMNTCNKVFKTRV